MKIEAGYSKDLRKVSNTANSDVVSSPRSRSHIRKR